MVTVAKTVRSQRTRAALVAAVHDQLAAEGAITADEIADAAGCTAATFWAHFGTKDDAIAAAFDVALDDLVTLAAELFGPDITPGSVPWAADVIDRLIAYFTERALLFRAAIARFPEHTGMRTAYRAAEERAVGAIAAGLGVGDDRETAVAVLVFCQGINNPALLRTSLASPIRRRLAVALAALADPGSP